MNFPSIDTFLEHLARVAGRLPEAQHVGLEAGARILADEAKNLIGQELDMWAPLAASTVEEKERLGYVNQVSATDPLLRTGELRASISAMADADGITLGSDDPIAPFQENGTARIPPRPFIGPTLIHHGQEATDRAANEILGALVGKSGPLRPVAGEDRQ